MAATFVETRKKTGNLYRPKFMWNLFCPELQFSDIQVPFSVLPNSVFANMKQIPEFEGKSSNIRIFPVYRTHPMCPQIQGDELAVRVADCNSNYAAKLAASKAANIAAAVTAKAKKRRKLFGKWCKKR